MIFNKYSKTIQWRKDSVFNKLCWENWISTCKRMMLDAYFIPYKKKKLKVDQRPKCET